MSFIADRVLFDGLTFDDVLLVPAFSEILPREVELATRFSRNIELKTPFVSAAMDTVTESNLAIAIAREGGIGVIHKNMSIAEQASQVNVVKRAENAIIYDPVTLLAGSSVGQCLKLMADYRIGGIPVVDSDRKLMGIVTNRDLRFEHDMGKLVDDIMTKDHLITTGQSTTLEQAAKILQQYKIEKLPVIDSLGNLVGLITYKDITKAKDKTECLQGLQGALASCRRCWRYKRFVAAHQSLGGCRCGCHSHRHGTCTFQVCHQFAPRSENDLSRIGCCRWQHRHGRSRQATCRSRR